MPLNLNSRRPPPPPPEDDDPNPPPVPYRPAAQKPVNRAANPLPSPDGVPPALPQRPGRNNPPPPPVEVEQEDYEDVTVAPTLSSLHPRPQPTSSTTAPSYHFSGANSGQRKMVPPPTKTKPKVTIRAWDSFKEVGNKYFNKTKNLGQQKANNETEAQTGAKEKKRRVTVGVMNSPDPEMLEDDCEPTDYEVPMQFDGSSSNFKSGSNHHSMQQRSDSSEDHSVLTDNVGPPDDVYVCPEEDELPDVCEGDYTAPDPVTPEILPMSNIKQSKGKPQFNTADLHMTRMNLNSTSQSEPKSPPPSSSTVSVSAVTKMLRDKLNFNDKPTPPPKPKKDGKTVLSPPNTTATKTGTLNKTSTTDMASSKSNEAKDRRDRKGSRSDDNASAGSITSTNVANAASEKKEKPAMLPRVTTSSAAKVHILPIAVAHDLKNRIQSPTEKNFNLNPVQARPSVPVPTNDVCEDIYDDGFTEVLTSYDWFHGDIDRKEAEKRVQAIGKAGTFLIRTSSGNSKTPNAVKFPYTLVIQTTSDVKNLRIRQRPDNTYAIGSTERADEVSFPDLKALVDHHRTNNVKIFRQDEGNQDEVVQLSVSAKKR